jgi:hypothetical protein
LKPIRWFGGLAQPAWRVRVRHVDRDELGDRVVRVETAAESAAAMWNSLIDSDPSAQILTAWIAKIERFETDVVAGFVLARAAAGLSDGTIRGDVSHLEQVRSGFGRPLWDMAPGDADAYFGEVLRTAPSGTRLARAQALRGISSLWSCGTRLRSIR